MSSASACASAVSIAALPPARSAPPTPLAQLYRHVWRHAAGQRGRWALALALLAGSQLLKLALPWFAAQAINTLQSGGTAALARAGAWIAAIVAVYCGVWSMHGPARVLERSVALQVRRRIADLLYARLAAAPLAWHERHHSGDLQHRVGLASTALYAFTQSQFIYLQNFINLVGPLAALALLSAPTGVVAAAGVLAVGTAIVRFDRALMRLAARENAAERRYTARLLDFVGNIGAVASLRLQNATRRLLDARLAAVFEPLKRTIVITEWKWCTVDLLGVALAWLLVVVYAFAEQRAVAGTVWIGSLFMVHAYAMQAAGVLGGIAANYQGLARNQADFAGADPIFAAPSSGAAPREPGAAAAKPASVLDAPVASPDAPRGWRTLALQHIGFAHAASERGGLHDLSLELIRGERIALVGPSGAGKSTLLRVMAGLYEAQHGSVLQDGVPRARRDAAEHATLIPQEAEVFEASLLENLTFGEPVPEPVLRDALHASAFDEVLAALPEGLATPMAERGVNLSGGQRQRLALARGLIAARGASLLLLDEPTSALDALIERHVHERLDAAFPDATIVASVHRLALLAQFDRVVLMAGGRIVDVGSVDELRERQPLFAAMARGVPPSALAAA